ncbi:MAG: TatD family hydrolase, partial [Edaphobacter sp.]
MSLIDSHAHLDFYTEDQEEVLRRAHAAGVHTILAIGIGEGPATMHQA